MYGTRKQRQGYVHVYPKGSAPNNLLIRCVQPIKDPDDLSFLSLRLWNHSSSSMTFCSSGIWKAASAYFSSWSGMRLERPTSCIRPIKITTFAFKCCRLFQSKQPGTILQTPLQLCHQLARLLFVRSNRIWLDAVQFLVGSATSVRTGARQDLTILETIFLIQEEDLH